MTNSRSKIAVLILLGTVAVLSIRIPAPKPPDTAAAVKKPLAKPDKPPVKPVDPAPDITCPTWPRQQSGVRSNPQIVEAGNIGPGNRQVMIDYPPQLWKANITSRGEGCCGFRSTDFAAHWQNVPALWGFPEWLQQKGLPGGADPDNVKARITAICQDRGVPEPNYIQSESKDFTLLKLILATGRLPVVDYAGQDGVHYAGPIAHCVCLVYCDDDFVCILDNNFPPDKLLWMPTAEFEKRWSGWIITLLAPRPPAPPHN